MPKVTYVEANGVEHSVDVDLQLSVMEGSILNEVPGIIGLCGGICGFVCGRCFGRNIGRFLTTNLYRQVELLRKGGVGVIHGGNP